MFFLIYNFSNILFFLKLPHLARKSQYLPEDAIHFLLRPHPDHSQEGLSIYELMIKCIVLVIFYMPASSARL